MNNVKQFAKEARARLLRNNYNKPTQKMPSTRVFKISQNAHDEKLYEKVCDIANEQSIVIDPIKRLMDETVFSKLNETGRFKYVLGLSKKYVSLMEKYRNSTRNNPLQLACVLAD